MRVQECVAALIESTDRLRRRELRQRSPPVNCHPPVLGIHRKSQPLRRDGLGKLHGDLLMNRDNSARLSPVPIAASRSINCTSGYFANRSIQYSKSSKSSAFF